MNWLPVDATGHPSPLRQAHVTGVAFSPQHELVYFANALGDVVSYDCQRRHPYAHFRAHDGPVVALSGHQEGVLSLSGTRLALHAPGGLLQASWSAEGLSSLATSRLMRSSVFIGSADSVYYYSLRNSEVISQIPIESPAISMAAAEQVYVGHECGKISVIDSRTNSIVLQVESHPFGVSSIAAQDQLLVTCGLTMRQNVKIPENTVRVYDIRTMKMVMPVPVPLGATAVCLGSADGAERERERERIVYALCPLRYQIATTNVDVSPPRRDAIHLAQTEEVSCFDVCSTNDVVAVGTASGTVHFLSKSFTSTINNLSSPLRYPGEPSDKREGPPLANKSSDLMGSDKYWGRTKPLIDLRLLQDAQRVNGVAFARNDRGLIPNMVQITTNAGITKAAAKDSFGLALLDGDVTHPHWNQIIRVLRQSTVIYDSIIAHCSQGCRAELCVLCELGLLFRSLHVSADDPIHIQHFLRVLHLTMPHLLSGDDTSASLKVAQGLQAIVDLLPALKHNLCCRQCGAAKKGGSPFNSVISVMRVQGTVTKTLIQAVEAASKERLWCDSCQGYRDFVIAALLEEVVQTLFFIIDPSAYRAHHAIEEQISLKKDQTALYLKGVLVESHGSRGGIDLKAMISHKDQWISCKNEFAASEPSGVGKVKALALVYDRNGACPNGPIKSAAAGVSPNKSAAAGVSPIESAAAGMSPIKSAAASVSPKSHIALDAEYVFYDKLQIEFCSDGSQHIVKPNKARLARLSVVGAHSDAVILDEFVALAPDETIVDYCTNISGIRPEDLTPKVSKHTLTTRKSLVMRLQALIDLDCLVIGHGLNNDFRVFNINLRPEQIIDTVELFHLPGNRFLSLKFLTWHFFGELIQTGEHDSIIDTRAAVRLYRHYQELCAGGDAALRATLVELYAQGNRMQWKVPE